MDKAKAIVEADPAFAASKEIEQVLWKPCFYKRIEDFRRRIRKVCDSALVPCAVLNADSNLSVPTVRDGACCRPQRPRALCARVG